MFKSCRAIRDRMRYCNRKRSDSLDIAHAFDLAPQFETVQQDRLTMLIYFQFKVCAALLALIGFKLTAG